MDGKNEYKCENRWDANNWVKSGSDDPDDVGHLGHLFDGSSGSHPQTIYIIWMMFLYTLQASNMAASVKQMNLRSTVYTIA